MASTLVTLCGQAYGAPEYQRLGTYTYTAMISLVLVCFPISILWVYIDKHLILLSQSPSISVEARKISVWLIPTVFPYAILQLMMCYLLSQSLIFPMLWSSVAVLVLHVPICWALVFQLGFETAGAALAIGISYTLNVIFPDFYLYSAKAYEKTCHLIVLLSGHLPNPQFEASVLSICPAVSALHYYVPYSFGAAASTHVSNELRAGNPQAAISDLLAVTDLGGVEVIIAITTLFCSRSNLGYAFGNKQELVDYVKDISLLCFTLFADTIQAILSGVARGSGWQDITYWCLH
ncbi:hypothetical protein L1987_44349 [Smallanthus sonchifolius]|uniref:Uncharacterized protein n=1 Tax=Smallanthus sonchifolius TaxID=185202 RepID=A0ACB9GP18_9ASTR|nr:hypothetical protein L1987_44349 [Smallanthus sonchifolius]